MKRERDQTGNSNIVLVWNPEEWGTERPFYDAVWKTKMVPGWEPAAGSNGNREAWDLADAEKEKAVLLTCSDQGIAAAHRWRLPVIAIRNEEFWREHGVQSLFGAPVLLEDAEALTGDLLETVWKRFYGVPLVIGETARCRIREIGGKDLRQLYEASGGVIHEGQPEAAGRSWEEYREFWDAYLRNQYTFYGYGLWLAEEKEQAGGLLGLAGFSDAGELSYWIVPEKRRRGYAREICSFLLEYAGENLGWKRVCARIREDNFPSLDLAESLGFCRIRRYQEKGVWVSEWRAVIPKEFGWRAWAK